MARFGTRAAAGLGTGVALATIVGCSNSSTLTEAPYGTPPPDCDSPSVQCTPPPDSGLDSDTDATADSTVEASGDDAGDDAAEDAGQSEASADDASSDASPDASGPDDASGGG